MIRRYCAFLILVFIISASRAVAQPTLPDIAAYPEKAGVQLFWVCQYAGLKAITVMRSQDSLSNYEIIGYVKKLDKGTQEFMDKQPPEGKNYYKLALVFKSGLTWRSNYTGINYTRASSPAVTVSPPTPPSGNNTTPELPSNTNPSSKPTPRQLESTFTDTVGKKQATTGVGISFVADTVIAKPNPPKPKIRISYDEPMDNSPIFTHSQYIRTDSVSGHIKLSLPDDVSSHNYSIKFFNSQNKTVIDLPHINTARSILDKRNFQKRGVYKFILRRDFTEFEAGYIILK